jgi:hypothetical protein
MSKLSPMWHTSCLVAHQSIIPLLFHYSIIIIRVNNILSLLVFTIIDNSNNIVVYSLDNKHESPDSRSCRLPMYLIHQYLIKMLQANSYLRLRLRYVCACVCAYVCVTFALTFAIRLRLRLRLRLRYVCACACAYGCDTLRQPASQLRLPLQANLHHTFANEAKLQPHTRFKPLQEKILTSVLPTVQSLGGGEGSGGGKGESCSSESCSLHQQHQEPHPLLCTNN